MSFDPYRLPPNERAPYLLREIIEHADETGALANATGDELRDALALAAEKIRDLRSAGRRVAELLDSHRVWIPGDPYRADDQEALMAWQTAAAD